jgi:hypothetical protein
VFFLQAQLLGSGFHTPPHQMGSDKYTTPLGARFDPGKSTRKAQAYKFKVNMHHVNRPVSRLLSRKKHDVEYMCAPFSISRFFCAIRLAALKKKSFQFVPLWHGRLAMWSKCATIRSSPGALAKWCR